MDLTITKVSEIKLTGLDLGRTTTNSNNQSMTDGGNLWQKFKSENYADKIPNKVCDEIYAVYYGYEGDHTAPFRYFIGCRTESNSIVPQGMDGLTIPSAVFKKVAAKGEMPDCMISTWKKIWASDIKRSYNFDFEIYDERSHNWRDAEVDIYLSVNQR